MIANQEIFSQKISGKLFFFLINSYVVVSNDQNKNGNAQHITQHSQLAVINHPRASGARLPSPQQRRDLQFKFKSANRSGGYLVHTVASRFLAAATARLISTNLTDSELETTCGPSGRHGRSEGLVSSVSPKIFPGRNAGGPSPVRSPQPVRKLLTPLPVHLHPQSGLSLSAGSTSATSQEAATPLDPVHNLARLRSTVSRPPQPPRISLGPPRPPSGSRHKANGSGFSHVVRYRTALGRR